MRKTLAVLLSLTALAWGQTTHEIDMAAAKDFAKADAELNQVYKQLMGKLDPGVKAKLVKSEQEWIEFRDLEAEAHAEVNKGGTIYPIVYTTTRTEITKDRIRELKEWLNDLDH